VTDPAASDQSYRVAPSTVREQVADAIRRALMARRFRPGQRLPESELCALTGASRTAVREAIRQLAGEGLIETIPHRGPFVATIDAARAADIYEIRIPLEALLARRAALRITAPQAAALTATLPAMAAAFAARDPLSIIEAKTAFYAALNTASANPELEEVLTRYARLLSLIWPAMIAETGTGDTAMAEVTEIVAAITAHDPDRAEAAMRRHIETAAAQAVDWLAAQERDAPRPPAQP
jgi:DNA-binding GntR family transcriptional regulator